ncbi:hypothetical protein LTR09_003760 [Extremus antarcticus]|uniref:Cupin type-2 domain-containing protein n=1 Tax=Extremus antarcticus TaxID=702011 RepID=A0AAJ0DJC5_9PEZI|nr:hypothetical protein LTR09_003760 [Extremus antarcticus]
MEPITTRKDPRTVERKIAYQHQLADHPAWTIIALVVTYPPGGSTPPHHHGAANVFAYVLEGEILGAMDDCDAKVYRAGDSWLVSSHQYSLMF